MECGQCCGALKPCAGPKFLKQAEALGYIFKPFCRDEFVGKIDDFLSA